MRMGRRKQTSDLIQTPNMTSLLPPFPLADGGNLQNPPQIAAELRASSQPSNAFGDKPHTLQRLQDK